MCAACCVVSFWDTICNTPTVLCLADFERTTRLRLRFNPEPSPIVCELALACKARTNLLLLTVIATLVESCRSFQAAVASPIWLWLMLT
jgi:hypothetical protein